MKKRENRRRRITEKISGRERERSEKVCRISGRPDRKRRRRRRKEGKKKERKVVKGEFIKSLFRKIKIIEKLKEIDRFDLMLT